MATVTTQFAVGDAVFFVAQVASEAPVECDVCSSTGKVTLSGREFACPACGGRKTRSGSKRSAVLPATVLRVQASQCTDTCTIKYWLRSDRGTMQRLQADVFATEAAALASIGG